MPQQLPLKTNNIPLALALHVAGATIERVQNVYSLEMLSKWNFRRPLEAVQRRKLGKVEIFLTPHPRVEQLKAKYDAAKASGESCELDGDLSEDDRVAFTVHVLTLRAWIDQLLYDPKAAWLRVTEGNTDEMDAYLRDYEAATAKAKNNQPLTTTEQALLTDERTFSGPGLKMVNATAPEATWKKLGL